MHRLKKVARVNYIMWIVVIIPVSMFAMTLLSTCSIADGIKAASNIFKHETWTEWKKWREMMTREYYRSIELEKAWEGRQFLNDGRRP